MEECMCNVNLAIKNEKDMNFVVYNIVLSKKNEEFSIEDIVKELKKYLDETPTELDKTPVEIERKVKKLFQEWLKNGIIEENINTFVRAAS